MIKALIAARIKKFEQKYSYDAGYMREILDVSIPLVLRLNKFAKNARYRKAAPKEIMAVANVAPRVDPVSSR